MKQLASAVLLLLISGCSILPYESEFQCPNVAGTGKCVGVDQAYEEAANGSADSPVAQSNDTTSHAHTDSALVDYEDAQFMALSRLLREPETPVVQQAKVVRTLIMAYPDDQNNQSRMYMPRFVYSIESKPKFIFGQYKLQQDVGIDIFKQLGGGVQ